MKVNKKLFFPALIFLFVIIAFVTVNLSNVQDAVDAAYEFCISKFGWFFALTNICCLIFSVWIMFGPYKNIRLGGDNCKPMFSTFSWSGMMFTTSCGAWLVVYGFLEPIYCAAQPPFQIESLSVQAYEYGQMYAHFHWGPNAWCIYVPVSVAIGYVLYNRNARRSSISETLVELSDKKLGKSVGYAADMFSIFGAVIAPVISIGTGMPLLVDLTENIFGIPDTYRMYIQVIILIIWIIIFGVSVYLGLKNGIKRLSNINIAAAFIFMIIFGFAAGIFKMLAAEINTVGLFVNNYVRMSTYTDPFGNGNFVKGWTFGYWACYFVYMPLMGVFNARISKGRRLKEIAFGQLVFCTLGCWVAMATFGNYSMDLQVNEKLNIADYLADGNESGAIIAILQTMPFPKIMMLVLLIISFIFLATTMDSSAFSAAEMTSKSKSGEDTAPRWLRIVWACTAAVIAFILTQIGGVKAVRSLCYIVGLPLAVVTYFIIAATVKMLRHDTDIRSESEKDEES